MEHSVVTNSYNARLLSTMEKKKTISLAMMFLLVLLVMIQTMSARPPSGSGKEIKTV